MFIADKYHYCIWIILFVNVRALNYPRVCCAEQMDVGEYCRSNPNGSNLQVYICTYTCEGYEIYKCIHVETGSYNVAMIFQCGGFMNFMSCFVIDGYPRISNS